MSAPVQDDLVSTIIPVYNRPQLLRRAVESVLAQTYRPIEIILVDDGSTDATPRVVAELVARHPKIIRAVTQSRQGPGAAREAGRLLVRGGFVQYLDSDDSLLPNKFALQVAGLLAHPECGVSYGKTRHHQLSPGCFWKRTGERMERMFPAFLRQRCWSTLTPLYRRLVVDRAGPWTSLRQEEDWEYDCRIAAQDVRLHYCDEFIAEIGHDDKRSASSEWARDPALLRDRAAAHVLIYAHATRAGIRTAAPEMQHFSRQLFSLARHCAARGLVPEARQLFALAREAAGEVRGAGADFRLYRAASALLGWRLTARLASLVDHCPSIWS